MSKLQWNIKVFEEKICNGCNKRKCEKRIVIEECTNMIYAKCCEYERKKDEVLDYNT